ncbi:MAG: glycosyltransferase family A protein [Pseudomonadota bacterium]
MARVFVGIPVFNGADYLAAALDSLITQTHTDWVALISDNASTDGTQEIAQAFSEKDERIKYHRHAKNLGAAPNFNYCVESASGRYFKWMAHDDMLRPSYLAHCVERLEEDEGAVLCHTHVLRIDNDGEVTGSYSKERDLNDPDPTTRFARTMALDHACVSVFGVMRLDILKQTPAIAPFVGSDRPLLAELALHGRLESVPEDLFLWRNHQKRSVQLKNRQVRLSWFNANARSIFASLMLRQLLANQYTALKVPKTYSGKARALLSTLKWAGKNRARLVKDLRAVGGALLRSLFGSMTRAKT